MTETGMVALRAAAILVSLAAGLAWSTAPAAAQARGVIIQIPDDVAPGAPRHVPAPPAAAPVAGPSIAPTPKDGAETACQGTACAADPTAWHVLNTSNRTCLVLSRNDLKGGGRDVRRLAALLPAPLFIVASGACP